MRGAGGVRRHGISVQSGRKQGQSRVCTPGFRLINMHAIMTSRWRQANALYITNA